MTVPNRLSTVVEERIIDKLIKAGYDEYKLDAASCALIKCYAQYAVGSEQYEHNLALAKEGQQYTEEQAKLKSTAVTVEYTVAPDYWAWASRTETREEGGFEYSQGNQIADGKQASDEFKINYIANKLGVDPSLVTLTQDGFNLAMIGVGVYQAGKLTEKGGLLADKLQNGNQSNLAGKGNAETLQIKTLGEYSAIKPGPLSNDLAGTFTGGKYKEVVLQQDTVLYRAGTADKPFGQFFSTESPQGILQTRIDKAVLPQWPGGGASPIDSSIAIKIPAGTKVYVGEVSSQNGIYVGGTQQIVVPKSLSIKGTEIIEVKPLK